MSEVQSIESHELAEAADFLPNEPQWLFDQSVPEDERERFSNDIAAALKTVDEDLQVVDHKSVAVFKTTPQGELKINHLVFGVIAFSSACGVRRKPSSMRASMITGLPPPSRTMSG